MSLNLQDSHQHHSNIIRDEAVAVSTSAAAVGTSPVFAQTEARKNVTSVLFSSLCLRVAHGDIYLQRGSQEGKSIQEVPALRRPAELFFSSDMEDVLVVLILDRMGWRSKRGSAARPPVARRRVEISPFNSMVTFVCFFLF